MSTKRIKIFILFLGTFIHVRPAFSQVDSTHQAPQQIAVFIPLYLDSAFDATQNYRYGKQMPKYFNPGLEFWEGVQFAIDSLNKEGINLEVHIYDTHGKKKFDQVLQDPELKEMDLLIGHVTVNEAASLARLAAELQVPFINANLPNDAGVTNNPYYVILNTTLGMHSNGIYKFLQKNFALSPIVLFTKKGQQEDRLKSYFLTAEKTTASVPLKIKIVTLDDNFQPDQLTKQLDANTTNVCIVGSLDINFGQNICQQLSAVSEKYTSTLIGMPTWDLVDFTRPSFKGIEIIYPSPFYANPTDKTVVAITEHFKNKFFEKPTETIYRGFESVYHFGRLLDLHKDSIGTALGEKKFLPITDLDIQPVINKTSKATDYFENRKLYFIKKEDGVIKAVY